LRQELACGGSKPLLSIIDFNGNGIDRKERQEQMDRKNAKKDSFLKRRKRGVLRNVDENLFLKLVAVLCVLSVHLFLAFFAVCRCCR
jgi:hypothetical protein